jgi:hypothetical protein
VEQAGFRIHERTGRRRSFRPTTRSWPARLFLSFPALRADAHELNGKILNFKSMGPDLGQRKLIQGGAIQVHNLVASDADNMVVAVRLGVVASRCARVVNATDQTQLSQRVEDSIHGSSRNLRVPLADRIKYLIRRGVVRPLQQHLEHGPPLSRHGQTLLSTHFLKSLEFVGTVHRHGIALYAI